MYTGGMWVRKVQAGATSKYVVLPPEALQALEWERGDHLVLWLQSPNQLIITKFDPRFRPDILADAQAREASDGSDEGEIQA